MTWILMAVLLGGSNPPTTIAKFNDEKSCLIAARELEFKSKFWRASDVTALCFKAEGVVQ